MTNCTDSGTGQTPRGFWRRVGSWRRVRSTAGFTAGLLALAVFAAPSPGNGAPSEPIIEETRDESKERKKKDRERRRDGSFKRNIVKERYRDMSTAERFPNTDQRERYEDWVDGVLPIITDAELDYFLAIEEDYRREAFMVEFWKVRDPNPGTSLNEMKVRWRSRSAEALSVFGTLDDARAVFYLFNGPPGRFRLRDGRVLSICYDKSNQLEAWFYGGSDQTQAHFAVVFHRRARLRPYEIWYPGFGLDAWPRRRLPTTNPRLLCAEEFLPLAQQLIRQDPTYPISIERWTTAPDPPEEWLATFQAETSELPPGAETFPADVTWVFPGRNQNRTTVQGVVTVPLDELTSRVFAGRELVHLTVTGEVLRNDRVFEQFRYRFELPVPKGAVTRERIASTAASDLAAGREPDVVVAESAGASVSSEDGGSDTEPPAAVEGDIAQSGQDEAAAVEPSGDPILDEEGSSEENADDAQTDLPDAPVASDGDRSLAEGTPSAGAPDPELTLPLVVTRYLRAGDARILLKIEDVFGDRYSRIESSLTVPRAADVESDARTLAEAFPYLAEALEAAERGERYLKIIPPNDPDGQMQYGMQRFETQAVGEFDEVTFYLDDEPVLTKRSEPFAVSLNLGTLPGLHRVRVGGFVDGKQVATDEITLNQGGQRFKIRLTEPRPDVEYTNSARAVAQVQVPDATELDRVEMYLNEERIATLYQEPFITSFPLDQQGISFVRAVAVLVDGSQTEDVAFINGPEFVDEIDVQYVQVYASITDGNNRAILDLEEEDVTVEEDGTEQELTRFEFVQELPVHAGLLIDTSTSMEGDIEKVRAAAERFVNGFVRQQDRVTVMSFDTRTQNRIGFTNDKEALVQALAGLEATGSTALYDATVYALSYFDGITTQRALLLLSDGEDETSLFDFDRTVEVARRSGVAIFAIGLGKAAGDRSSRRTLTTLSEETGGRAFFIDTVDELDRIYAEIDQDLRTRYLMVYQSTSDKAENEFRAIKVKVKRRGANVRTMSGYYP